MKLAYAFDQFEVIDLKNKNVKKKITVKNLTSYDASVKILAESEDQAQKPFYLNSYLNWKEMKIKAGETITLKL